MKKTIPALHIIILLYLPATVLCCKGQTQRDNAMATDQQKTEATGMPKIVLPEGASPETMFRCSFMDKDGNLWFGTTGAGVYKYDGHAFFRYAEKDGLTSTFVTGISQDTQGKIWIATNDGIFYGNGNSFSRLAVPQASSQSGTLSPDAGSATPSENLQVFCVISDKKGNTWFGTEARGLWRYDGNALTNFRRVDSAWAEVPKGGSADYRQDGFVSALLEDKKGNIWIAISGNCLSYFDGTTFHNAEVSQSRYHTLQMTEDQSGNIWLATRLNGVCRYDGKTVTSFTAKDGVADDMASCLYADETGNIWFGSLGKAGSGGDGVKGITVYNGETFRAIPPSGMRNNQVWTVIGDRSGNLWVGTKAFGLYRYDGKTFTGFTVL